MTFHILKAIFIKKCKIIMFAIIKTSGIQINVKKEDIIKINHTSGEVGSYIRINKLLLIKKDNQKIEIGTPYIKNASIIAKIIAQIKDKKIIILKKKKRKGYKKKLSHRQDVTYLKIISIEL